MSAILLGAVGGAVGAGLVLAIVAIVASIVWPCLPMGDPYEGDADEVEIRRRGG